MEVYTAAACHENEQMNGILRRGQSASPPTLEGISVVAYLSPAQNCTKEDVKASTQNAQQGCYLLLGSARNALAAVSMDNPFLDHNADTDKDATETISIRISRIISVADRNKSNQILKAVKNQILISSHWMADRLRPEQDVDVQQVTAAAVASIEQAVGWSAHETLVQAPHSMHDDASTAEHPAKQNARGILIHCNEGHNRSPTLVVSYLIQCGLSLRTAYQYLLRARPTVDPLPPYRRGLWSMEDQNEEHLSNISVQPNEAFHRHISELKQRVRAQHQNGSNSEASITEAAVQVRRDAIHSLLAEPGSPFYADSTPLVSHLDMNSLN